MNEILVAQSLKKTFKLSAKQQKIEKTNQKLKVAVDGLSFSAYRGEIFGLLGPNGAGKTTTLRMIATLIRPDEGDVTVEGISAVNDPAEVRGRIGFLTSELKLEDFSPPTISLTSSRSFTASIPKWPPHARPSCLPNSASTALPRSRWPTCPRA